MKYEEYFNNSSVQVFLVIAILIYFVFRLFHFLNRRFVLQQKHRKNIRSFIYLLEFFTWLLFITESANYFSSSNLIVSIILGIILLVIILWITWYILKEYIAGLYLKWINEFKLNEEIKIDGQSGKIIKLDGRQLVIEIGPLHTISIPYSHLFSKKVIKTGLTDLNANVSFTINLSKKYKYPENIKQIRDYIYQLPWTNINHQPAIVVESKDKDKTIVRISASLIDEDNTEQFKDNLRGKFE